MNRKLRYAAYLQSEDWQKKRSAKFARSRICALCGAKKKLQVHHLVYRDLWDVRLTDLRVVCNACHEIIHDLLKGGALIYENDDPAHRWAMTLAVLGLDEMPPSLPPKTSRRKKWRARTPMLRMKEWMRTQRRKAKVKRFSRLPEDDSIWEAYWKLWCIQNGREPTLTRAWRG